MSFLYYQLVSEFGYPPTKAHETDAGYDIYSAYDYHIPARGSILIQTDLAIQLPENTYGRIAPRSGLAIHHHLDVGAGVIDSNYRGPIGVLLFNHGDSFYTIRRGDRVAQLIVTKIEPTILIKLDELSPSPRGSRGFGSSGK